MGRKTLLFPVIATIFIIPALLSAGWTRTYGGEANDGGYCIQETSDGGYIVSGYSYSSNSLWILKTDEQGDTLWTTRDSVDWRLGVGYSVAETSDGGWIVTGYVAPFRDGKHHLYLIRLDSDGQVLWTRGDWEWFDGPVGGVGNSVRQTSDGGYIIAGATSPLFGEIEDLWLIKTDAAGDTLWTRIYGGEGPDCGLCVCETSENGYIVSGYSSYETAKYMWLLKIDSEGDTVWTTSLPSFDAERSPGELYSVLETSDGGCIMTGYIAVTLDGKPHLCLFKTDSEGDSLWCRFDWDWFTDWDSTGGVGLSMQETSDGGYVITGHRSGFGVFVTDLWLIKTDSEGEHLWSRIYGGEAEDMGNSVDQTADGGYIIAGETRSFGAGNYDLWLLRTDSEGDTLTGIQESVIDLASNWHVLSPVAREIVLRYEDFPHGFHASVFDVSGRRVDELHSTQPSGTITWPVTPVTPVTHRSPGVYFIRISGISQRGAARVVLLK